MWLMASSGRKRRTTVRPARPDDPAGRVSERVLLVGHEAAVSRQVRNACDEMGVALRCVDDLDDVVGIAGPRGPAVLLCDFATFQRARRRWPRICAVVIADTADSEQAIESTEQGALDYLPRPLRPETLLQRVREAFRVSRDARIPTEPDSVAVDGQAERIVEQSPPMQEVYKLIGLVAPRDINVLITGESGTGKELVARAIYHHSRRRDGPFLAVNCAAIPETLLESELFGHEKGAFTGADQRLLGKFEQCKQGTLFLDEVGDIPLPTQAKLLRVLEETTFQRLGGTDTIECDVRVIAATNQPLERLVKQHRFREDLYYRLNVASMDVPPLREREVDVVLLAHYFIRRLNHPFDTQIHNFSPDALHLLLTYPWPGNVRELENVMEASLVVARGSIFQLEFLPEHIRTPAKHAPDQEASKAGDSQRSDLDGCLERITEVLMADAAIPGTLYERATSMVQREVIRAALDRTAGRVAPAARLLGLSRTTLRKKMRDYGIRISAVRPHDTA